MKKLNISLPFYADTAINSVETTNKNTAIYIKGVKAVYDDDNFQLLTIINFTAVFRLSDRALDIHFNSCDKYTRRLLSSLDEWSILYSRFMDYFLEY